MNDLREIFALSGVQRAQAGQAVLIETEAHERDRIGDIAGAIGKFRSAMSFWTCAIGTDGCEHDRRRS